MQGGFHEHSHPPGSCDHVMDEPPPLLPGGLLFFQNSDSVQCTVLKSGFLGEGRSFSILYSVHSVMLGGMGWGVTGERRGDLRRHGGKSSAEECRSQGQTSESQGQEAGPPSRARPAVITVTLLKNKPRTLVQ